MSTPSDALILRLITRLNIGGPAIQALMLTKDLRDEYPTVLGAGESPAREGRLTDPEVPVQPLPLVRELRPAADVRALVSIRRMISHLGPKVVHTHMAKAGVLGRLAAFTSQPRPKTVHTFHGHVLQGYFTAPAERTFIEIEGRLARRTDVLLAVSEEVRDDLLERGIGRPDQVHVIPLGFDLAPFLSLSERSGALRTKLHVGHDVALIGTLGRLAPIKDHSTLLRAMVSVPNAHLVVMGDGELSNQLQKESLRLGIAARTHFIGWRTDVAECIADLDVVALSSRNEGTPVSLIEAQASGKPTVATDVGGVRSVVDHGVTGFLCAPGDHEAIAVSLNRLIGDPGLRSVFGARGRQRVKDRFSKRRLETDIRELYRSLLGT